MSEVVNKKYDFVVLFDVENGNPNGDPDAGNMPRIDPETGHGLVTDVCLKRKIRNYIQLKKGEVSPYRIYVKEKSVLQRFHAESHAAVGIVASTNKDAKRQGDGDEIEKAKKWMCSNFYDIRAFGAVMSTKINCGTVTGPIQLCFAKSIDPIVPIEISITRTAVTTEEESTKQQGDNHTMGRKYIVPYALYKAEGYVIPSHAAKTGFNTDDLELLWEAIYNMFENDHTATRPKMNVHKLYIFEHENSLGSVHSHKLFSLIKIEKKVETPRSINDYTITISNPEKVKLIDYCK